MNTIRNGRIALCAILGLGVLGAGFSCSGGASGRASPGSVAKGAARAKLVSVEFGRRVDVYAWRRVNNSADRIDPRNREPVLVLRDVVINPQVRNEDPISNSQARYRFLPYDPSVGHRELLILFDDQAETRAFEDALAGAMSALPTVKPYFAFSKGLPTTPPVVPDDACIKLTFDRALGLDTAYFAATPSAVQILRLTADPEVVDPSLAYTPVNVRVVSQDNGKILLVDPEVSGNEAGSRNPNPEGLPPSLDGLTANIRIALPTEGTITKEFRVQPDAIPTLNSVDVNNKKAVIRDLRSANSQDENNGHLIDVEDPMLVARKAMGILSVDLQNRILMLNKQFADVIIRGRLPYVDGPTSRIDGKPLGAQKVPQGTPFLHGDVLWQDVISPAGERVRVKAEVLRNLEIPEVEDDPSLGIGGGNPIARVEVSTVRGFDSKGNQVTFAANDLPLGADCTCVVHYHHQVEINGKEVGDSTRLAEFLTFVPAPPRLDANRNPVPPNENIDPMASVALSFSKPMALGTVRPEDNFVIANKLGAEARFIEHVKVGNLAVVPTLAADLSLDATTIRLSTPLGLFHQKGSEELYYVHLRDGKEGPRDRSGRMLDLFDLVDVPALTFNFSLDDERGDNLVASVLRRMNSPDEDGTSDQDTTLDYFGQFQQRDGRLFGWPSTRFSRVADNTTLATVRRDLCGECVAQGAKQAPCAGIPNPMVLYQTPLMIFNIPPLAGGISEPFVAQGSRLQMTYREDDFQLNYIDPTQLEIDVEQLHWAPFVGRTPSLLTYDLFDRVTIILGTAEKRPDMRPQVVTQGPSQCCTWDGASFLSGLTPSFAGNYVDNGVPVEVVKDKAYAINPNNAFATSTGSTMIPYPKFDQTYTWRDRRYMGWDFSSNVARGLGGSQQPNDPNTPDRTKDITSPHVPEVNPDIDGMNCKQPDDYLGNNTQDHGPFALPLLVDFLVYPDDPENGLAKGDNLFQIGYIGPIYPNPGHGYYNQGWPWLRVHSTGGLDNQQNQIIVDPRNERLASGGWLNNQILGRFQAPPGDDHIYWAQGDFVRKISVVTYGYVDMLQPGKNEVQGPQGWAGDKAGYPNLAAISTKHRPAEFAILMSPAPEKLPQGTKVLVEYRGSETFDKADTVYAFKADETASSRGNLLNPHFACEQYRYQWSARVLSSGFTNYVKDPDDLINGDTLVAPRYLNVRFTFVNNTNVSPARIPFVDYFALAWRVKDPK